jgi:hypothetical protein
MSCPSCGKNIPDYSSFLSRVREGHSRRGALCPSADVVPTDSARPGPCLLEMTTCSRQLTSAKTTRSWSFSLTSSQDSFEQL